MKPFAHPLWLVGFRPFFSLACLAGALLPLLWVLIFSGILSAPASLALAPLQWHGHEMFYGFGWAVLGGFLLTSTKNWVGIRGYHGGTLAFLAAAWLLERLAMAVGSTWPPALVQLSSYLFLAAMVALLVATLIRHRAQDSYRDNLYFIVALPLFLPAKYLLLEPEHFASGRSMTLALFRLAFLLMLERTLTQFMKGIFQLSLPRLAALDHAIKGLALVLVFGFLLPPVMTAAISSLLALLLLARWLLWQPLVGLRRLDIGIMYLGYLAMIVQLLVEFAGQLGYAPWVGTLSVHLFTVGVMGLIVPAMLIRISKGHTGRKVVFDGRDKAVLCLMLAAFVIRILLPQVWPASYFPWMHLAACCWLAAFGLLGWRVIPWLFQPRVDGKEH